jgi:hypothetical protein
MLPAMKRVERKLLAIADELSRLATEQEQVDAELEFHRHIADDAVRDAAVSGGDFDRMDADQTVADVRRFERRLDEIARRRAKLDETRIRLLEKLD